MKENFNEHSDLRYANYGGAIYLFVESFLWLLSATFGLLSKNNLAIWILIIGGMFIHPISQLISKIMGIVKVHKDNSLPILNTWLALIIPLTLPLIFMAIADGKTYLFYPSFSIVIGAHWLPFIYVYKMKSYIGLSAIFVAIGIIFGFIYKVPFATCGFVGGIVLLVFGIINFILVKAELKKI